MEWWWHCYAHKPSAYYELVVFKIWQTHNYNYMRCPSCNSSSTENTRFSCQ